MGSRSNFQFGGKTQLTKPTKKQKGNLLAKLPLLHSISSPKTWGFFFGISAGGGGPCKGEEFPLRLFVANSGLRGEHF